MRTEAFTIRRGDMLRMGPTASGRVRDVTPSTVLAEGVHVHVTVDGVPMHVHMRDDAPADVLRREGRAWTETQRQWAYDNDVACSRPGGGA